MMGLNNSLHFTTQIMGWAEEIIWVYYRDCDNHFSDQTSVLIFQKVLNIHLAYHGCQISLIRKTWPQTYGPIFIIL